MYKREKTKLHRIKKELPENAEGRVLDYGLWDITNVCYPHYAVVDGTVCMEGFGPSGGDPVNLDVVLASAEPVAADMIALKLMEIPLNDIGHLKLIAKAREVSYASIDVEPSDYEKWRRKFKTAGEARLGLSCNELIMEDESACSACHASLIQFLRYHTHEFAGSPKTYTIFAGKDIKQEDIEKAENPCLVGNCTAKFRDLAPFCKGCPPIPSEITKTLKGESGLEITYLGHSCFTIRSKEYTLLIDPFLSGNPNAALSAEEVEASHILVSHAHGDHIGDTDAIAQRCGSVVFCTPEVSTLLSETIKIEQGQPGGNIRTDFGNIKFVTAAHGSGVPGGVACGFVITIEEKKIYFAGDTQLIKDMELLQDEEIDIAMLPIGDRFTMGPDDAIKAAKMINPAMVIPMHYNTMPAIMQDPVEFKEKLEQKAGIEAMILSVGEKLSL